MKMCPSLFASTSKTGFLRMDASQYTLLSETRFFAFFYFAFRRFTVVG